MERDGIARLALDIIRSAVNDYKELIKDGVETKKDRKYGNFSKEELVEFFKGDWCKFLLSALGAGITGEEILKKLSE